jgi:hypothetical protein
LLNGAVFPWHLSASEKSIAQNGVLAACFCLYEQKKGDDARHSDAQSSGCIERFLQIDILKRS